MTRDAARPAARISWLLCCLAALASTTCRPGTSGKTDVNRDGYVDAQDRSIVEACALDPTADPRCARADVNGDAIVDALDLERVDRNLGRILFDPGEAYVAQKVAADDRGVVYLFDLNSDRMYRWSLADDRALISFPTTSDTLTTAYSESHGRVYVGRSDMSIVAIDPLFPDVASPFAVLPNHPRGLVGTGAFLFAIHSNATGSIRKHSTFAADGTLLATKTGTVARDLAWSALLQRVYFHRPGLSPDTILWEAIDPVTGGIGAEGQAPSGMTIKPPLRLSPDETRLALGSGDVHAGNPPLYQASVPFEPKDLLWLPDGGLLTIRAGAAGGTLLEDWSPALMPRDARLLPGAPLGVVASAGHVAVVTIDAGRTRVHGHVPGGDGDGDGVAYAADRFPLDPAASLDTDADGHPDAWNEGAGPADSTTGLVLDAFPLDAACQLPEHGSAAEPGVCVVEERIPDYEPMAVAVDGAGTVHLLGDSRVFRWSLVTQQHLSPVPAGPAGEMAAVPGHGRIYLGHWIDGAITSFDPDDAFPRATYFSATPDFLQSLADAGSLLLATDSMLARTFDASGTSLSARSGVGGGWFDWDPGSQRLFYAGGDPSDVYRVAVDQVTGAIGTPRDSPYFNEIPVMGPLRVSPDGDVFALGSGYLYDADGLELAAQLPIEPADLLWLADGVLLTIRADGAGGTLLEQWNAALQPAGSAAFPGEPRFLVEGAGRRAVITLLGGRPAFFPFDPIDDADSDGVPVALDAFPLDPAASVDGDGDGAPDAWNPGAGPEDSTTGLALDAFPDDPACQRAEHSVGGVCDYRLALPHDPEQPLCELDTPPAAGTEGVLALGSSEGVVPLCDGWLLLAQNSLLGGKRVVARNLLDGRIGESFPLPGQPGALALDEARRIAWAALPAQNAVAAIDLQTGAVSTYTLPDPALNLALDPDGNLFIGTSGDDLSYLPVGGSAAIGDWNIDGTDFLAWNASAGELLAAESWSNFLDLSRYTFTPATGPQPVQSSPGESSGSGVALSPDGQQLAVASRASMSSPRVVRHFAPSALQTPLGEWLVPPPEPRALAFDPTSTRLAASNGTDVLVFDVASHALLETQVVPPDGQCTAIRRVGFSRGGRIAFGQSVCGYPLFSTRLFWRVLP